MQPIQKSFYKRPFLLDVAPQETIVEINSFWTRQQAVQMSAAVDGWSILCYKDKTRIGQQNMRVFPELSSHTQPQSVVTKNNSVLHYEAPKWHEPLTVETWGSIQNNYFCCQ